MTLVDKSSTRKPSAKGTKRVSKASQFTASGTSQKAKRQLTPAAQLMERLSEEVEQDYIEEAERLSLALDRALKRGSGRR
jgi:N-glycosylase/DNA lyase